MTKIKLFGTRHHGPASGVRLKRLITSFKPQAILLEAPSNMTVDLAPLVDSATRFPVAISVGTSFMPLDEHSPETAAFSAGLSPDIDLFFIDVPIGHDNPQDPGIDARGPMPEVHQLFERLEFRLEPLPDMGEAYMALAEQVYNGSHRDKYMRQKFEQIKPNYDRILVVVGAAHLPAFTDPDILDKPDKYTYDDRPVPGFFVPWSAKKMSVWTYGAGVLAPDYAHQIYHAGRRGQDPDEFIREWVIKLADFIRQHNFSAPPSVVSDVLNFINASLAIQNVDWPTIDDILNGFVTNVPEIDGTSQEFMKNLYQEFFIGDRTGFISSSYQSPIIADFESQRPDGDAHELFETDPLNRFFALTLLGQLGYVRSSRSHGRHRTYKTEYDEDVSVIHQRLAELGHFGPTLREAVRTEFLFQLPDMPLDGVVKRLYLLSEAQVPELGDAILALGDKTHSTKDLVVLLRAGAILRVVDYQKKYTSEIAAIDQKIESTLSRVIGSVHLDDIRPAITQYHRCRRDDPQWVQFLKNEVNRRLSHNPSVVGLLTYLLWFTDECDEQDIEHLMNLYKSGIELVVFLTGFGDSSFLENNVPLLSLILDWYAQFVAASSDEDVRYIQLPLYLFLEKLDRAVVVRALSFINIDDDDIDDIFSSDFDGI